MGVLYRQYPVMQAGGECFRRSHSARSFVEGEVFFSGHLCCRCTQSRGTCIGDAFLCAAAALNGEPRRFRLKTHEKNTPGERHAVERAATQHGHTVGARRGQAQPWAPQRTSHNDGRPTTPGERTRCLVGDAGAHAFCRAQL